MEPPRPHPARVPVLSLVLWQCGSCMAIAALYLGHQALAVNFVHFPLRQQGCGLDVPPCCRLPFGGHESRPLASNCFPPPPRHTLANLTRSSRLHTTPLSHGGPIISCSKPASATLFLPPFCLAPAATVADTVAGGSSPLQDPLCPWPCLTGFIPGTTAHFGSLNAHRRIARYFYSWRWAWYTGPVCV